jgi:hypothetical protein
MLGAIGADLRDRPGVDVVPLAGTRTIYGFRNENWKPWTMFDGTPVLVAGVMNTDLEPNGNLLMYPEGDRSAPPSAIMPHGGYYFDTILRQPPLDDALLRVEDNLAAAWSLPSTTSSPTCRSATCWPCTRSCGKEVKQRPIRQALPEGCHRSLGHRAAL